MVTDTSISNIKKNNVSSNKLKKKIIKENALTLVIKYFITGLKETLYTFKEVGYCAWSGFNIVILNPLSKLSGKQKVAANTQEAFNGTLNGVKNEKNVVKEKSAIEQALENLWHKTIFYKSELKAEQKEKEEFLAVLGSEEGTKRQSKPTTYRYKIRDEKGRIVQDTFVGVSMADCNAFLLNQGYEVISIKTSKKIEFLYGQSSIGAKKLSTKDLIFWLTQLSTYVKSGIPVTDAMRILAKQMNKDASKKRLFDSIVYELTLGESFSQALAKQGSTFPPLLINMLKASEATGDLEGTLDEMANYYSEVDQTRRQMISALTYPILVMIFAIGVITFILLYVVPQFTNIYNSSGVQITGLTKFVIDTANFLKANIFNIIGIVFLGVVAIVVLYKNVKVFRRELQVLAMKIPVVKNVIIYNEITIFTKTFASLLKNNVFITESIDILSKITQNEIYKEIMFDTINNIARGDKISDSFKDHWAVPDVAYYMIVTGESTGELAVMMDRVSKFYQELHRNIVGTLKAFIEPILIAGLAVVVGGVILAVIIPMFGMYEQISMQGGLLWFML
ncbi:MAG: type II secretion system F family protein [Bacilli bacterium]